MTSRLISQPYKSARQRLVTSLAVLLGVSLLTVGGASSVSAVGPTVPPRPAAPSGPPAPKAAPTAKKPAAKKPSSKKSSSKKAAVTGIGQGAKGAQVEAIQTRLQELKFDVPEITGTFGDQTFHAVMAFQKLNGLSRTGRVGPQTLAALESATEPEPLLADGGGDRVEVDIERQILMVWKDNQLAHVLSVSTGNNKDFCVLDPDTGKTDCDVAKTPGGSFRVTRRWVGWRESRLGEMYNPLYFNGGIAIHGSPSVPAYPASHGCVRIPMVSAEWFPTVIDDGTPVYVFGPDKTPTPLKSKAPANSKPSTVPPSTLPGGAPAPTTVPNASNPATTPATTSTTTTLVRLLNPSATTTAAPSTAVPTPTPAPTTGVPSTTIPAPTTTTTTVATTTTTRPA